MDEEENFPVLCPKKTYSKPFKKMTRAVSESNNVENTFRLKKKAYDPGVPLTTKVAVEYLLNGKLKTSVCRYCLKVTVGLSELDQIMQIAGTGVMYKVSIREMIACFYPFKARQDENFPEKICQRCIDRALNAYLFTQQCEQAERALHNCFDDINEKSNKLDPVDRPKKRGRQKLHPNFNKLYVENSKVMDYAEPLRNIINLQTESLSNEPDWNEFECKKCWQVLPDLESLLNHEQIHPKYMWYHCRLCGKSFVKLNQLKKHFNQVHVRGKEVTEEAVKTFKCLECGNVTDNYVHHLQHIEKHKFKSVMKHLIEKKTDQLCLVCLKKCTDLVELDKMVCIHGNCPELVGDKTLKMVLASTLPDQKSYKYQELHVPRKADIMTITKRKRKYQEIQNIPHIIQGTQFILSLPKIITKDNFKTEDFYYYVFCEPQAENYDISTIDNNIAAQYTRNPRIFEIANEETMGCNLDDNMPTEGTEGTSVIGQYCNRDFIPNSGKKPVDIFRNNDSEVEMIIDDNEDIDLIKSIKQNNEIQVKDRTHILDSKLNGKKADQMNLFKNYNTFDEIEMDDKQTVDLTRNSNVKDDILKVKEAMNVVGKENNMLLHNITKPIDLIKKDNPEGVNIEKYPTEHSNLEKEVNKTSFIDSKSSMFTFSNPIGVRFVHNHNFKLDAEMTSKFKFSHPNHGGRSNSQSFVDFKQNTEMDFPKYNIRPMKVNTALSWIFIKTTDKKNSVKDNKEIDNIINVLARPKIKEINCNFCWLFKKSTKCEYCKKPIDEGHKIIQEVKQMIQKNTVLDSITKYDTEKLVTATFITENVETRTKPNKFEKQTEKIWQCNVCLTSNNKDRSTCHCCESKKFIENGDYKVTFGHNKTFFINNFLTHEKENKNDSNIEKGVDVSIKKSTPLIVIDETSMMDTKLTIQENIAIQVDNRETNSMHSMDIETNSVNYIFNSKLPINEEMDVEEEPFTFNTVEKFDPTPIKIANISPYISNIGTNIQFNIGSSLTSNPVRHEKGARKFVKAVRKMPKAFHK